MSRVALDEQRLRKLIEACRTLASELDLEAVLGRFLEAARDMTGARYAALGVLDKRNEELERFLTFGIDEETRARIGDLPRGHGVLGLLITNPEPVRLEDLGEHPRSYGFPPGHPPMKSFLGVPIRIRGRAYGSLYLTEKEGGPFDAADEEAAVILADFVAIAIENARSVAADRVARTIEASERERARWARELHDDTLQGLGALRVLLASSLRRRSPSVLEGAVEAAVSTLESEIQNLRGLISELRPAALDELGVEVAIQGLAERTAAAHGLVVETELALSAGRRPRDGERDLDLESTVYRIVQEALTNVTKHSRAERVRLGVVERGGAIEVSVEDDGVGFDPGAGRKGFGILGIEERVAMAGGRLEIRSSPGTGTSLKVVVPSG